MVTNLILEQATSSVRTLCGPENSPTGNVKKITSKPSAMEVRCSNRNIGRKRVGYLEGGGGKEGETSKKGFRPPQVRTTLVLRHCAVYVAFGRIWGGQCVSPIVFYEEVDSRGRQSSCSNGFP
jgi:hypothetical protein